MFRARGNPLSARGEVANGRYRWVVLAVSVVAQATFLGAVFQGLPVLAPELRSAYGLSLGQLGLVLSSVAVGILITLLAWGAAADRFGERRVMVLGLLGAAVALLVAARRWAHVSIPTVPWSSHSLSERGRTASPGSFETISLAASASTSASDVAVARAGLPAGSDDAETSVYHGGLVLAVAAGKLGMSLSPPLPLTVARLGKQNRTRR